MGGSSAISRATILTPIGDLVYSGIEEHHMVRIAKGEIAESKRTNIKPARAKPAGAKSAKAKPPRAKPGKGRTASARRGKSPPRHRRSPEAKLAELKQRLLEISDINYTGAVLSWDTATYMPPKGADARGRQTALLGRIAHEKSVDPALGRLLDALLPHSETLPRDSDEASLIRVARRDYEKAIKVPSDYVERASALSSAAFVAWTKARPANDFAAVAPLLEKNVELSREYAGFFAPFSHVADPAIDDFDAGMTTEKVRALFAELRRELVPLVRAITAQDPVDDRCLHGTFAEPAQLAFGVSVVKRLGYDFERGRIDKTHHPFCTKFSAGDVRITTRFDEHDIGDALFSTIHESGHAMYEQGVAPALAGTPLGSGTSAGVHESQSRLWENVVGRGRGFWTCFYPALRDAFADPFAAVPPETFYRAINRVKRSLIRTDADEVTYNLHVMMRFDLESDMLEGRLKVKDLPEAWRARMQADLGVAPQDDRDGCMQDVHWFSGGIGGSFQGYTIGNILSAQFHAAAVKAHPDLPHEIARGNFRQLHDWLVANVHRHGRKFEPDELVARATGQPMTIAPYLAYLRGKYGELYKLP
jgi:carboxypeptidase Taq